ncbi:sn-glycerol-3-phosphate ABC transporter ATP-binding protein UgpC [Photobacterium sp. BZF1]|uniref:ABC transporter ATP-binding protein n=1 Tax=Photobacterium sp. BZF1 TaxID=1904457 RepID=UPI0016535417|nr:sn-glycerol-3-phosphate ABC transporter ATP-binding protein UgpC [Photobacterium sp. BZF1]MBC7004050.1 sn-glycerol-3-phosphate ABC transporter ATP-binding protein UgpC [Photobacterium sp. BZF1]
MAGISLNRAVKRFGKVQTIHGIDLTIEDGEFTVFVGPSGCGKSTLLRLIAGLEDITEGDISIGGVNMNDVEPSERGVAMVFQSYALYPHMTVEENMGFGLKMVGEKPEVIKQRVKHASDILQLEALLKRKPKELSGGQRQRVAIGRAIVRDPEVFLFDEPLSNLDAELRVEMRIQIARLHKQLGNTMVYVTHDQVEAMTLADKIVVLRDGRVEQVGSPLQLYYQPANEFVAGFIGSPKMNFIPAMVAKKESQSLTLTLPDGQSVSIAAHTDGVEAGQAVKVGIRPEHIFLKPQGSEENTVGIEFQSDVVERLGNSTYLFGQYAGVDGFKIHLPTDEPVVTGNKVKVYMDNHNLHLFNENGLSIRQYSDADVPTQICA